MRLHILGVCGTFMAGVAALARELGLTVTGSDAGCYPPMSTQLERIGVSVHTYDEGLDVALGLDAVIVGNVAKRGMPIVEEMLDQGVSYTSGPQWLGETVLHDKHVLAVSGTHGKTTTSSLLAWMLASAGLNPGFLIGGVPENFGVSARLGGGKYFVIEADEYDTAFFDKRAKFVHYRPQTLIINNIEFDHADIYTDLLAIQTQFSHLLRMVPAKGVVITPHGKQAVESTLARGCWSRQQYFGSQAFEGWWVQPESADFSSFSIYQHEQLVGQVQWSLLGEHNALNALAALLAARDAGVDPQVAIAAMSSFKSVKRRLELCFERGGVRWYDDFAHHPTAILGVLQGLRAQRQSGRLIALLELGSYTLRQGVHLKSLVEALKIADVVLLLSPSDTAFSVDDMLSRMGKMLHVFNHVEGMVNYAVQAVDEGDTLVTMSSRGFAGIHDKLQLALQAKFAEDMSVS